MAVVKPFDEVGEAAGGTANDEMPVVRHQCPRETLELEVRRVVAEETHELGVVGVPVEDPATVTTSGEEVVRRPFHPHAQRPAHALTISATPTAKRAVDQLALNWHDSQLTGDGV